MHHAWLLLDFVAKRYGCLPSKVLKSGSSIDVECANFAVAYEAHVKKQVENGHKPTKHSNDQLQAMIDAVRRRDEENGIAAG